MTAGATATLPWSWYADPQILRLEQERILRRSWHYAGRVDQVERAGDSFPARAGDVPVAVVRGEDGDLRAFVNVCRHRGAVLVEAAQRRTTLQCRYHAWTYGLDGSLLRAPRTEREPGLDLGDLSLRPVRVDTWGPFVFVNPDLETPSLAAVLGELPRLLREHGVDLARLRFRERISSSVGANWKLAVENYLECYHCPVAHRGFSALVDVSPDTYALEARDGLWSQFGRARGDADGEERCQFHLLWPNLRVNVFPGPPNLSIGPLVPQGVERTVGFLDYFFGEGVDDAAMRELVALDEEVGREDRELVESVQSGVRCGVLEHGALMPESERLIGAFQARVARELAQDC